MKFRPLAEEMRPKTLEDFAGQEHLVGKPDGIIYKMIQKKRLSSLVFWGPPGCGKTTLARIYIAASDRPHFAIQPGSAQVSELKKIIDRAEDNPLLYSPTILWIDEVHRLTRPQQDILLSSVEGGSIILIAATTENPSFQLAPALLSRLQVITLKPLEAPALLHLIERVENKRGALPFEPAVKEALARQAQGDARILLKWLEELYQYEGGTATLADIEKILNKRTTAIDPTGEGRYQLISALHKSVRSSDVNAALYWFCRQVAAGEDIRYIARRVLRMAAEDIGLADPQAMHVALNALKTYETLGSPEGDLAVAEAIAYMALAPKSNSIYTAFNEALASAKRSGHLPPPKHLINGVTKWMKNEGFGDGYIYDHDLPNGVSGQQCFPDNFAPEVYYHPQERGFERDLKRRMEYFERLRKELSQS